MSVTNKTLAEQLQISEPEIRTRKRLLGLTPEGEAALGAFRPTIEALAEGIVGELYDHQLENAEFRAIVSDSDTLARMRAAMHSYVLRLFDGDYGLDYVNARLRIGKVHARIGVSPKLYIASQHHLEMVLRQRAIRHGATPDLLEALHKLFLFDLQLVFDTYIQGLMSQVEVARDQLRDYADSLETEVAERTAEIAQIARRDPLTGLDNRREFFRALAESAAQARATGRPLALGFFDTDDFKTINDRFGHLHGDRVLARIGAAMNKRFAAAGRVFRYGGDEFCVLLPDTDEASARVACQAFCDTLDAGATISFGVASLTEDDGDEIDRLIARADAAMYCDKAEPALLRRGA